MSIDFEEVVTRIVEADINEAWFFVEFKRRVILLVSDQSYFDEQRTIANEVLLLYFIIACRRDSDEGELGLIDVETRFNEDSNALWAQGLVSVDRLTVRPKKVKRLLSEKDLETIVGMLPKTSRFESEAWIDRTLTTYTFEGFVTSCTTNINALYTKLMERLTRYPNQTDEAQVHSDEKDGSS